MGGSFDKEESQRALLRTHTTVNTVRHIADNPHTPSRVFGIGRVFRQETIDRTHMPEFHQIEGIIHEPDASLPMLISTLKTFYSKMGYPDVRVRPAYFPYTEPSAEVDILWKESGSSSEGPESSGQKLQNHWVPSGRYAPGEWASRDWRCWS